MGCVLRSQRIKERSKTLNQWIQEAISFSKILGDSGDTGRRVGGQWGTMEGELRKLLESNPVEQRLHLMGLCGQSFQWPQL